MIIFGFFCMPKPEFTACRVCSGLVVMPGEPVDPQTGLRPYDGRKARVPSWTDRVLWRSFPNADTWMVKAVVLICLLASAWLPFKESIWTMTNSYIIHSASLLFLHSRLFSVEQSAKLARCLNIAHAQTRTHTTYAMNSYIDRYQGVRQNKFSDLPDDPPFFCALRNLFLKVALTAVPPRFAPVTILPSEQFFACQWRDPIISTRMPPTGEFTSDWANWPQQVLGEVTTIFPFGPSTAMRTNTRPMPQASVARQRSTPSS